MKKILIAIIIISIFVCQFKASNSFSLIDYFDGEYTIYTKNKSENAINLGFCFMQKNRQSTENIIGESLVVENLEVGSAIKTLNAKVIKTEYIENGIVVIYAYTNKILTNVKVDGKPVNLQIAQRENDFVIGWPLILGDF